MKRTEPDRPPRRFTKASRLRRKPEFSHVFGQGIRVQGRYFTVLMAPAAGTTSRLGIVASKKLGNAVRRNRAKRLIREVFRHNGRLRGRQVADIVVIPRRELFDAPYASLDADLRSAFSRGAGRLPRQEPH